MRKIVGQYWNDEDEDLRDAIIDIDRTDDNEVSVTATDGGNQVASLFFTADYEARELVNALNKARADQ